MSRTGPPSVLPHARLIEERLHARNSAKKARGEVFTPLTLVQEMLLGIRRGALEEGRIEIWGVDASGSYFDDNERDRLGGIPLSVWRDPTTKWLDPAGGIGNFLVVAYGYLDYQLGVHGPARMRDEAVRRRHIMDNMLYMFELDAENVRTAKAIFEGLVHEATGGSNFYRRDTLKLDAKTIKELCGVSHFDVIMGNPPFNSGGVKSSGTGAGYETLWPHFLLRGGGNGSKTFPGALSLLSAGGHLCMIHPSSWLHQVSASGDHTLHNELLGRRVLFMRAYTNLQSHKLFHYSAAVPCAYYTISNVAASPRSRFPYVDVLGHMESLPNKPGTIFQHSNKLMQAVRAVPTIGETGWLTGRGKLSVGAAAAADTGKYDYVCQHLAGGVNLCKSSVEPAYFGEPRILLKGTSKLYHFDDWDGKYGLYGHWGYIIRGGTTPSLRRMAKFLDTKFAHTIMAATKEDQDFIEPKWLPDVREIDESVRMTDAALCAHFGVPADSLKAVEQYNNVQTILQKSAKCGRDTCSLRKGGTRRVRRHL